jgi:hypothetical protein
MTSSINTLSTPSPLAHMMQAPVPAVSTPSISSSSMLVELNISTWTGRKLDKKASAEVVSQKNAATGVANVNKKLLGDCAELEAVQKFTANARNMHYAMTLPWSDSGLRLLPTARYFKYVEAITAAQQETEKLVEGFLSSYQWEVTQAQIRLGDLFNADEYPTADALRHKFRFRVNYLPLPDSGDWRIDIANETKDALRSQYEDYYGQQLTQAMSDIWERAFKALSKMSERLDYPNKDDKSTKKIFHGSLVENVLEIVDIMNTCNVTNNPKMSQAAQDLTRALSGITAEALREDDYLRAETKRMVDGIMDKHIKPELSPQLASQIASLPGLM